MLIGLLVQAMALGAAFGAAPRNYRQTLETIRADAVRSIIDVHVTVTELETVIARMTRLSNEIDACMSEMREDTSPRGSQPRLPTTANPAVPPRVAMHRPDAPLDPVVPTNPPRHDRRVPPIPVKNASTERAMPH